jgi:hypothetical protein
MITIQIFMDLYLTLAQLVGVETKTPLKGAYLGW